MSNRRLKWLLAVIVAALTIGTIQSAAQVSTTTGMMYIRRIGQTLLFSPDATYDIGASGATRPRNVFISGQLTAGNGVNAGGNVQVPAASIMYWTGRTLMSSPADGLVLLQNTAQNNFTRLQFGGTTSSFPAIKVSSNTFQMRLADDSAFTTVVAATYDASGGAYKVNNNVIVSSTAPTISSGFGTSPSIVANNGTGAFTVNVGTGGVATSGVIGLPTATTGWNCFVIDRTTNVVTRETATTTTTATLTAASAWAASDILQVSCFGY